MNRRRELARETKYRNKNKGGRKEERKDLAAACVTRLPSAERSQQKGRQLESMMMTTTTTTTTLQHTTSLCVYLVSYLPFLHVEFAWDGFLSQGISGILQRNHQPLLFSLSFSPSCSKYFKTRNSWEMQHPLSLEHLQRCFVCDLCKNISRIQVLVIYFFTTLPPPSN
jgi:hypothetical protein